MVNGHGLIVVGEAHGAKSGKGRAFTLVELLVNSCSWIYEGRKMRRCHSALFILVLAAASSCSKLPVYEAFRTKDGIKVDGHLNEPDWKSAEGIKLQFPWEGQTGAKQETIVKILWDDENIYLGYGCRDQDITAVYDTHDDPTYKDDCVEFFISPNADKLDLYYGLEMNCRAALFDYFCIFKRSLIKKFDLRGVKLATSIRGTLNASGDVDKGWSLEVSIPFNNFDDLTENLPPKAGTSWRINLNRWDGVEPHRRLSMWSPSGLKDPDPHNPARFGRLLFSGQSVASHR